MIRAISGEFRGRAAVDPSVGIPRRFLGTGPVWKIVSLEDGKHNPV